jgi:hypothetical protein
MMTRNDSLVGVIRHIQIVTVEHLTGQVTEMTDIVKMTGHCGMNFFSGETGSLKSTRNTNPDLHTFLHKCFNSGPGIASFTCLP